MSESKMPKKRQKTYSLPQPIVDRLHNYFEENKEMWAKAGNNRRRKQVENSD
jgi:hypothetical protein